MSEGPDPTQPNGTYPADGSGSEDSGRRKPKLAILLGFLATFLLLLIVFREVLFPFLLAIFLAYLIEPVVSRVEKSRLFGMKWTRGPTIVLLYIIVVGGLTFAAWKGLTVTAAKAQSTARLVTKDMKREGGRAILTLLPEKPDEESSGHAGPDPILLPRGAIVRTAEGLEYETLHEARIDVGESDATILLHLKNPSSEALRPREGDKLTLIEGEIKAPDGARFDLEKGTETTGVELMLERRLIGPIVRNLAERGWAVAPTTVRSFVDLKARGLSKDLPEKIGVAAVRFGGKVVLSIYEFFLILMITAFIVMDRRQIADFFAGLAPAVHRPAYLKLVKYIDDGLAGVIRGQLMICLVNGVLTYVGMLLLGIPGALLLSVMAAVLSLIPIFGTIISSVPIVLIGATKGIDIGIFALLWIIFIHVLEANVLNPLIMGSHARMHPVVIIFALLAGEHYFGVWGALLAVPTASIVQSCFLFYLHEVEGRPHVAPKPHGASFHKVLGWFKSKLSGRKSAE